MKVELLSYEEQIANDATHRVTIPYTDLTDTAGLTKTIAIFPVSGTAAIGTLCSVAKACVTTAFAGTTTLTLEIGDGGDTDRVLTASDMKATAGAWYSTNVTAKVPFAAADTVDALFTATVDNLTALTAGQVVILLKIEQNVRALV